MLEKFLTRARALVIGGGFGFGLGFGSIGESSTDGASGAVII